MALTCRELARLLSEKRDRGLPWRVRLSLRLHLWACNMCRVYGAQLNTVNRVCKEAGARAEHECPGALSEERKQHMKETLEKGA